MDQEFFKKIIFSLDSPLYITDTDGIILFVNPAFEKVTGYHAEEAVGKKTSIIKSGEMPHSYYENLWKTLLAGKTWKEEIINKRKDGTEYTVLQYVTPVSDEQGGILYFAAAQYDITREKELQNEKDIFFDVSVDLFCIMERTGTLKQINDAWKTILGWKYEDLERKSMIDLLHPEDKKQYTRTEQQAIQDGNINALDVRVCAKDGGYKWVSWRIYFHTRKELFYASGRDIQKRVEMEEEIRKISITDELTGIYNRLKFNEEIEKELSKARRYAAPCSLILFDIDHFKTINDTYGHNSGDDVLRTLALVVQAQLRETDLFCRWGGEELVIICPHTSDKEAYLLAERIREKVESFQFKTVGHITISAGAGEYLPNSDTAESLLKRIDTALYKAKEQGRNQVVPAKRKGNNET
jgi:diguanylate cyclase (GGDEF)-like protein/PAS domain S-box-containing protein